MYPLINQLYADNIGKNEPYTDFHEIRNAIKQASSKEARKKP